MKKDKIKKEEESEGMFGLKDNSGEVFLPRI